MSIYIISIQIFIGLFLLVGCIPGQTENVQPQNQPIETQSANQIASVGYTYHSSSGNRYVKGSADITTLNPLDITLPEKAYWLAAASLGEQSIWVVVMTDGNVKAFRVNNANFEEVSITPNQLFDTVPPTLIVELDGAVKLANISDGSRKSASVIVDQSNDTRAYIADNGDIVLWKEGVEQRLAVDALTHGRILIDEQQRLLVLTKNDTSYGHTAVLGSQYPHAKAIALIETQPDLQLASTITLNAVDVVEGNALIWEDVNGDGQREIITTLSNDVVGTQGGRIVVFSEDGSVFGESDAIGMHNRWRHQIAVAPFKSVDETSLVSIYVPHLDPFVEYFRLDDESMSRESLSIFNSSSSHLYTGPNIDMSLVGDFDGDDKIELMLIDRVDRDSIVAYEYSEEGITQDWVLDLANSISSNAAAVTLDNDSIAYGVGQGKSLRIWHP